MSESAPAASPVATGRLEEQADGAIVLSIPGTDYRLHLAVAAALDVQPREKVRGRITGNAKKVVVSPAGGRFIEPSYGRPRRVQGVVIDGDPAANTLTVHAGVPITCRLTDPRQKTTDFAIGQMVNFDVERGATFKPE